MYSLTQLKQASLLFLIVLLGFGFLPAQAVVPPPDGGYPNFTTAEGTNALLNLTSGAGNTAVGWYSLFSAGAANNNTGVGAGALALTTSDDNTAVGLAAMFLNTVGHDNVAVGTAALLNNASGNWNNAIGAFALHDNINGFNNNALGQAALFRNIHGTDNTAIGDSALLNNDMTGTANGNFNTAVGSAALFSNTDGDSNTAVGYLALFQSVLSPNNCAFGRRALENNDSGGGGLAGANNAFGVEALRDNVDGDSNNAFGFRACAANFDGFNNSAFGDFALGNNDSGSNNTAIGVTAGSAISGNGNVCIGAGVAGEGGANDSTYIRNIGTTPQPIGGAVLAVTVNSMTNRLGYDPSSRRYKEDIQPMDEASEALFSLKPVTYRFKKNVDPNQFLTYGLIAEDVAKVNPNLALRNANGEIESIRYESINAMLLNEFLKEHKAFVEEHRTVQEQGAAIALLQEQVEALSAGLQKVSAQLAAASPSDGGLELSKPASQMVLNSR
jgi:hypothetical protein